MIFETFPDQARLVQRSIVEYESHGILTFAGTQDAMLLAQETSDEETWPREGSVAHR